MKNKVILALILLVIAIGSVSATETTGGDYKFNVPDDLEQDHSQDVNGTKERFDSIDCHVYRKTFGKYFQQITITVFSHDNKEFPDYYKSYYPGGHDASLKGMDGYMALDGRDYVYSYVVDGDWVVIRTWDPYGIEGMIIAK